MAVLVHITSEERQKRIKESGIKTGKYSKVVFFMPVVKEYLISHQWARELKRSGIKNFVAVYFKLNNTEKVWFGRYLGGHEKMALNRAIEIFQNTEDKLGYEFLIERKIDPKEITKIQKIPKPMGWRYEPTAHGKKPCPCPSCLQRGGYKTNKLREVDEFMTKREAKEVLCHSNDEDLLYEAAGALRNKWRTESPEYLERLLDTKDEYLLYELVQLIAKHRDPLTKVYLTKLSSSEDEDVKELAMEYLNQI